jgi:hypothetical protein
MRWAGLLALLPLVAATPARAQDLGARVEGALNRVTQVTAETFGRSLPLPSASAGVSYAFDPATGTFQRQPSTFGQVYIDRARPIGARKWNVQVTYQHAQLDRIDGQDAGDLSDSTPIYFPGAFAAVTLPKLAAQAATNQFLLAGTYGITDDLEVSLAIPLVQSRTAAQATLRAAAILASDGSLFRRQLTFDGVETAFGVGDLLLRAKYRVLATDAVDVAAGLLLRLPTGDVENLRGVGFLEVAPAVLASSRIFRLRSWARLQGHFNASVGFDTENVDNSEARWGIGLDWGITDRVTAAIGVLGRNQFARVAPPGFFDFPRCFGADLVTCATSQQPRGGTAPLFGLSGARVDYYDLSIGGRGAVWKDTVFAFANVLIPLNDGFVRTEPIPLLGLEATF